MASILYNEYAKKLAELYLAEMKGIIDVDGKTFYGGYAKNGETLNILNPHFSGYYPSIYIDFAKREEISEEERIRFIYGYHEPREY